MTTALQFANPWLLALLVLVALVVAYRLWTSQQRRPATVRHAATSFVRDLPAGWRVTWRPLLSILRAAAIILMVLALARPQIVQGKETIKGEGVDMALAVDISGSMAALDFQPSNRLEAAKAVIAGFVAKRPYDRIGLVAFASEAFNQVPLTLDRNAFTRSLEQIKLATDLGIADNTAIGLGLANAANTLAQSDAKSKVIVLLTDGVNNAGEIDPLTAAEAAKALGIKIYTIGAAKLGQVPVPVTDMLGSRQIAYQESQIDEDTLRKVAETTGGKYFRAEDTQGLQAIYDAINNLEKSKVEVDVFNQYQELASWLLIPALLLLVAEAVLGQTIFRKVP
jgi:Ca-activated chloride channel family protein